MSTVLVTGVNGFVGPHLVRELHKHGHQVIGSGHRPKVAPEIGTLLVNYVACDLLDRKQVDKLPFGDVDAVINLAGLASVGPSFDRPEEYKTTNDGVLASVGEALKKFAPYARLIAVSTGAVYDVDQPKPFTEDSQLLGEKGSPYAISKIMMEQTASDLREAGLDCVVVRPFNHIGPGQKDDFIAPDLYNKLIASQTAEGIVTVGDLTTKRDYTDVRDVARAYRELAFATSLLHNVYNVCSGKSRSGEEVLDMLLKATGLAGQVEVQVDPAVSKRPKGQDPSDLYGDASRLRNETGWSPTIPFEQTIQDFVTSQAA